MQLHTLSLKLLLDEVCILWADAVVAGKFLLDEVCPLLGDVVEEYKFLPDDGWSLYVELLAVGELLLNEV